MIMHDQVENPYIGPRSFKEGQANRFFGRDYEATELLALVISNRLVMYYAQSGAGKSSLINARLAPDLRKEGFLVLPIGRVSGISAGDLSKPVKNIYAYNLMLSLVQNQEAAPDRTADETRRKELEPYANLDLVQFFRQLATKDGLHYFHDPSLEGEGELGEAESDMPHVLLIDQFEEILITNVDRWTDRQGFFEQLGVAMRADPMMWVVFVLREDYVATLDPFAYLLPGKLRTGFYMQRMAREAAREAITRPASSAGRPFEDAAADQLLDKLSQIRIQSQKEPIPGQFVEPVQLQVVCHQLWEKLEARDQKRGELSTSITSDDLALAPVDRALGDFYDTAVADTIAAFPKISEIALRTWFEDELITSARTRGTVYQDGQAAGSLANDAVAFLQRRYLLRGASRAGGRWIELIHDSLVEPILEANQVWWLGQGPLVRAAKAWEDSGRLPAGLQLDQEIRDRIATVDIDSLDPFLARFVTEALRLADEEAGREQTLRRDFATTGWGVIFASDADPALKEALLELIDWRDQQAGDRFRLFWGEAGYRSRERADQFLQRHGADVGRFDLDAMPYYLLIVGSPDVIPFEFQYQLARTYAVGRLYFEHLGEYAQYAHNVVEAETRSLALPKEAVLFSTIHDNDMATRRLTERFIEPFALALSKDHAEWQILAATREEATKARLSKLLNGDERASFIFTASHGLQLEEGHRQQKVNQGAVVCSDWPGPAKWHGDMRPEFYFAASDLTEEAQLLGTIVFLFGQFSAGTPQKENFARRQGREAQDLAEKAFLARLPQRLLSLPRGGALAVIGHVDINWAYSWMGLSGQAGQDDRRNIFMQFTDRLFAGHPVGSAMRDFGQQYQELASIWSDMELQNLSGESVDSINHVTVETAMIDIRNFIVIGDPAVRLMVSDFLVDTPELETDDVFAEIPERGIVEPPGPTLRLKFHPDRILEVSWSPAGDAILTLCGDGAYRVWEVNGTGFKLLEEATRTRPVFARWSPDGQRMATVSRRGVVSVWDAQTTELIRTLAGPWEPAAHVDWRPDGRMLAINGLYSAALHIVDVEDGELIAALQGDVYAVRWSCWSPVQDGQILTVEESGRIRLWDSTDGAMLATLGEDLGEQIVIAWSPDAKLLAFAGDAQRSGSNAISLWDMPEQRVARLLPGHNGPLAFIEWLPDDDGRLLALDGSGQIHFWDTSNAEVVYQAKYVGADSAERIALSQDGEILLIIDEDDRARLFNIKSGAFGPDLLELQGPFQAAAWSPVSASKYLLVEDRTLRILELANG